MSGSITTMPNQVEQGVEDGELQGVVVARDSQMSR